MAKRIINPQVEVPQFELTITEIETARSTFTLMAYKVVAAVT